MPRRAAVTLAIAVLLALAAAPAAAKGPTGATITGPGIAEPIIIEGFGERGGGGNFSALVEAAGFWALVGGVESFGPGGVLDGRPAGDLGPMHLVAWHLGTATTEAEVYLSADGGPVVHVAPDNIVEYGISAPGGWFAASAALPELLAGYGVPVQEEAQVEAPVKEPTAASVTSVPAMAAAPMGDEGSGTWPFVAAAGAIALTAAAMLRAVGRRPRRIGAP